MDFSDEFFPSPPRRRFSFRFLRLAFAHFPVFLSPTCAFAPHSGPTFCHLASCHFSFNLFPFLPFLSLINNRSDAYGIPWREIYRKDTLCSRGILKIPRKHPFSFSSIHFLRFSHRMCSFVVLAPVALIRFTCFNCNSFET